MISQKGITTNKVRSILLLALLFGASNVQAAYAQNPVTWYSS
jgi:hypothetical protein